VFYIFGGFDFLYFEVLHRRLADDHRVFSFSIVTFLNLYNHDDFDVFDLYLAEFFRMTVCLPEPVTGAYDRIFSFVILFSSQST